MQESQRPCGWSPGIKRSSVSTENLFKRKAKPKYTFFRISTESKSWVNINRDRAEADTGRGKTAPVAEGVYPNGDRRSVSCETVEPETTLSSTFHTNTPPNFHVANIQNLLTKRELKNINNFTKEIEKIKFLREMCKEERPYFLAFAETWLNDKMKEAEYEIEGYTHVASH